MKFICQKEKLIEAINFVQKAVSSKSTVPLLTGILLEAKNNLKLTANDLEIAIECTLEADIQEQGSIVINSKIFGEIIRKMPDSDVLITVNPKTEESESNENNLEENNDSIVLIECEGSFFKIKGLHPDGFPTLPEIKEDFSFVIQEKTLREMIRQTIFAVSIDDTKTILTGSLIQLESQELFFVSIDGYRVALRKTEIEKPMTDDFKVIVPGKTLSEILKILKASDEEVIIHKSKNQILFTIGNCKVLSRLLDGEFLNHKNIIPKEFSTKIKLKTSEILLSIERASLISMDGDKYPLKFNINNNLMLIFSNAMAGSVREELEVDVEGENIEIAFNPRYFIEALRVIDSEHVLLCFTSEYGPCTIKPIEGDEFAYMILPVKTL